MKVPIEPLLDLPSRLLESEKECANLRLLLREARVVIEDLRECLSEFEGFTGSWGRNEEEAMERSEDLLYRI